MDKKIYEQPKTLIVEIPVVCGLGDQTGSGGGASLDLKFEEETRPEEGETEITE